MQVRDVMHGEVVTVPEDATVAQAAGTMLSHGISGVPVLDRTGAVVGLVTEGDFLRRAEIGTERRRARWLEFLTSSRRLADDYVRSHARAVGEIMSRPVATIGQDAPLEEAVALMLARRIKRLPVLRDGALVGIVSRSDLLRAFARAASAAGSEPRATWTPADDRAIADAVMAALDREPWAANGAVRVEVQGAVAHLHGTILDERERMAARVLAENVPGVNAVHDHLAWVEPLSGTVIPSPEDEAASAVRGNPPGAA